MAAVDKRSGERAKSAMALTKWMVETKVAQVHLFFGGSRFKGAATERLDRVVQRIEYSE